MPQQFISVQYIEICTLYCRTTNHNANSLQLNLGLHKKNQQGVKRFQGVRGLETFQLLLGCSLQVYLCLLGRCEEDSNASITMQNCQHAHLQWPLSQHCSVHMFQKSTQNYASSGYTQHRLQLPPHMNVLGDIKYCSSGASMPH